MFLGVSPPNEQAQWEAEIARALRAPFLFALTERNEPMQRQKVIVTKVPPAEVPELGATPVTLRASVKLVSAHTPDGSPVAIRWNATPKSCTST